MRSIDGRSKRLSGAAPRVRTGAVGPLSAAGPVPATRQSLLLVTLLTLAFVGVGSLAAFAVEVSVTRIDGRTVEGQWLGFSTEGGLAMATSSGPDNISIDDVMSVVFTKAVDEPALAGADADANAEDKASTAMLYLADGGRLPGAFLGGSEETIRARTAIGPSVDLPLAALAGLRLVRPGLFAKAESLYQSALRNRLPGQDVLVTRDADEPKVLRGRLESIDSDSGSFTLGTRTRTFRMDRIYGLVFASGLSRIERFPVRFELRDGSVFTGRLAAGDEHSLTVANSFSASLTVPLGKLARLDVRSPRLVYLSDIEPTRVQVEGRVHRAWEVSRDHGLMGRPLSLDGKAYAKGIACHSRSELSYELTEPFVAFVAHIGIDDYVRPRGSVVFRVTGDGKELFSSGLVTGRDKSSLLRVGIEGVKTLTLIVDYGDELDVADHAVWGAARLLKP